MFIERDWADNSTKVIRAVLLRKTNTETSGAGRGTSGADCTQLFLQTVSAA
jgi:hypothetical protein